MMDVIHIDDYAAPVHELGGFDGKGVWKPNGAIKHLVGQVESMRQQLAECQETIKDLECECDLRALATKAKNEELSAAWATIRATEKDRVERMERADKAEQQLAALQAKYDKCERERDEWKSEFKPTHCLSVHDGDIPLYTHPAPTVLEDWQPVPKEPTEEMVKAAHANYESDDYTGATSTYKAMLAAAPKPEDVK